MQASILIVSKNRKAALEKTLIFLRSFIDLSVHEVLVFLDGCTDESLSLKAQFDWVQWEVAEKSMGASPARNILYKKATGQILIGLDDDAHPLYADFIERTAAIFEKNSTVGVLAFEEIKGVFNSDQEALLYKQQVLNEYFCSEFVGCGFAIRKTVYDSTRGFPVWIDIYGEESCVSIEVLANGYDILYTNTISVNHRVDSIERALQGRNYFRFGKQLTNTALYYLVYYPFPFFKLAKLFWHNFKKYACSDWTYFKTYFKAIYDVFLHLPQLRQYRKPICVNDLERIQKLQSPKYF